MGKGTTQKRHGGGIGGRVLKTIEKTPTGIEGFDEITQGGLPKGRPTLVCGGPGCGKTLFAMEFIVRGATLYNEPGVFMAFEETEEELAVNVASLGYDINRLVAEKKLILDCVRIEKSEIIETGEYDLEGLFIRLNYAIDQIKAKRVVIDTVEALFGGLKNEGIVRAEIRRLFRWLKEKGVTAIITGERGDMGLTRQGLEEYVSDCVILLDQRVSEHISTRRMRIVKYRGSMHGTNEYPFFIGNEGFSVLPVTALKLEHTVSNEYISSGIEGIDEMLGGKGFFRGSTVLISGTPGTGKTSFAAQFTDASCRKGERVMYCAFEESPSQIIRNMRSIGLKLDQWVEKGLLRFFAVRPTEYGLETHLSSTIRLVNEFKPSIVILDPADTFVIGGNNVEVKMMLIRLIDFLKRRGVTGLFTNLTPGGTNIEHTEVAISSLIDTWLLLKDIEGSSERNRGIYILKSRGMKTSNQIREFIITDYGIELRDVYVGTEGVLTGTDRVLQEEKDRAEELSIMAEIEGKEIEREHMKKLMANRINSLESLFSMKGKEIEREIERMRARLAVLQKMRMEAEKSRTGKIKGS